MMIAYWIVTDCGCKEITGYHFRSLVYQLIECMLSVGTRFTPDHRTCLIKYRIAIAVN